MTELIEKVGDLIIEQLRKSGLNTLLLVVGLFYYGNKDNTHQTLTLEENARLKDEVKVLTGTVIVKQQEIIGNQEKMLSNQEKGLELLRYKNQTASDERP